MFSFFINVVFICGIISGFTNSKLVSPLRTHSDWICNISDKVQNIHFDICYKNFVSDLIEKTFSKVS